MRGMVGGLKNLSCDKSHNVIVSQKVPNRHLEPKDETLRFTQGDRKSKGSEWGELWGHLTQLLDLLVMKNSPIKNMLQICTISVSYKYDF